MTRRAVVLFNLGGPTSLDAVEPFLFNLFNDKAIISLPQPLRMILAKFIAKRRLKTAKEIYRKMGGESPLLKQTEAQAAALENKLAETFSGDESRVFIAMRYWIPRAGEAVLQVKNFEPDEVILLPLYPQYSTATTASSIAEWKRLAKGLGLNADTKAVCCYPTEHGLTEAFAQGILQEISQIREKTKPRILFSYHGLPKKVVARGDPYQWQSEQTTKAILKALDKHGVKNPDTVNCYQSRVGPLEWIGPSTDEEIERAGKDKVPVVVVPAAFVSEHSETLVELDMEYGALAEKAGVPEYRRVPTVQTKTAFIEGLAELVANAAGSDRTIGSQEGGRICPAEHSQCPVNDI